MKQKINARQRREAEALRRKQAFAPPKKAASRTEPAPSPGPEIPPEKSVPSRTPEEETREFLEYLERYDAPAGKDDPSPAVRKKPAPAGKIPGLNLEDGMPTVSEALERMDLGIQEMRHSRIRCVKLIHGYGSTGRGGKIRIGVRSELAAMKRRKLIRDYIPGEDFGPADAASRKLVENDPAVSRDPDYGRMNHGITIIIL